jgi:hypothetical protein
VVAAIGSEDLLHDGSQVSTGSVEAGRGGFGSCEGGHMRHHLLIRTAAGDVKWLFSG